jgi:hypothetical protein
VQLLLARLTWDWESLKKLQQGDAFEALEQQIIRMDICHYAFPENLVRLLGGLGKLKAISNFEGCGSYSPGIRDTVKSELAELDRQLRSLLREPAVKEKEDRAKDTQIRAWLTACFMKTLKEQAGLNAPPIRLE